MRMPIFFCLEAKVTSTIYSCKQLPKLKKPPERKVDLRLSGIHTPMKVALATPIINVSETKLAKGGHPERVDRRHVIYQSLSYQPFLQNYQKSALYCPQLQNIPRA